MTTQVHPETLAFYQSLDADVFADKMLERDLVAKHCSRELLAKCWVRAMQSAQEQESDPGWQNIVAYLFATGIVEGLLWAVQAEAVQSLKSYEEGAR